MSVRPLFTRLVQGFLFAALLVLATGGTASSAARLLNCTTPNHQCKVAASNNYRQCAVYPYQRPTCVVNLNNQNRACFANFQRCLHYNACISGQRYYCQFVR